ncbi:DUF4124 domain-containing protein [Pseudorhodoferax sp.]|uniref:DUF4124 domain-containing protein n=1 Tax=Pseudorhodoferax sp. TaxID=1993553 RepID=UPI0039E31C3D
MTARRGRLLLGAALAAGAIGGAQAQPQGSIYTCVDAQGRRITSDRPILECIDRVQKELNPSGTVRRQIGPSLTAAEREAIEAREHRAAEEQRRAGEELRRNRALLARYRDQAAHDRARAEALALVDGGLDVAHQRLAELARQRIRLDQELEFYVNTPERVPAPLRRQVEEHDAAVAQQRRFIAEQEAERRRVNERYDEELARLRQLWAEQAASTRAPR